MGTCIKVLDYAEPFKRGFFCNDESLMHPFHPSTVGKSLIWVGFGLPIVTIVISEFVRWKFSKRDENSELKLFERDIPNWIVNIYKHVAVFLFGALTTMTATDSAKIIVGRFRPHFFDVCHPIMRDGTNCSNPINWHRYIEDFTCENKQSSIEKLRQMRMSFPSGHSSLAMFTMVFAAIFLHRRMNWSGPKLLKHFVQFLIVMMAWFTALSRIPDYKHHCEFAFLIQSALL